MSEILVQKEVRVKRITTLNYLEANGLGDTTRIKILAILAQKPMTAEEVTKALTGSGLKKATTTVRHHLDTLKRAGLVETAKVVEVRGAVMKYYSANIKTYTCNTSADFDVKAAKTINDTSVKVAKILKSVYSDKRFLTLAENEGKCKEYLAVEIINAALARAIANRGIMKS